jgi:hypothetical protein
VAEDDYGTSSRVVSAHVKETEKPFALLPCRAGIHFVEIVNEWLGVPPIWLPEGAELWLFGEGAGEILDSWRAFAHPTAGGTVRIVDLALKTDLEEAVSSAQAVVTLGEPVSQISPSIRRSRIVVVPQILVQDSSGEPVGVSDDDALVECETPMSLKITLIRALTGSGSVEAG